MRRAASLVLLLVVGLAVSGCGGNDAAKKARSLTPAQRLAVAQRYLDATKAVTIALRASELPKGTSGILKADGVGTKAPAFKGTISVVQSGLSVQVPVVSVGGGVYVKFGGSYQKIDPDDFGAPDPATLFAKGGGFSSVLGSATKVAKGKDTRQGKQILSTLTGTVAGATVAAIIPSAADRPFDAVFTLDDRNHLVQAKLTGPFYSGADDVTYTIGFSKYGVTQSISKP